MSLCPKCGTPQDEGVETCTKCGVVFAKLKTPRPASEPGPPPHPRLGRYEYKTIEVAENVVVRSESGTGNEAAAYLEEIVNAEAYEGWEFYRIDQMKLSVDSPALFGTRVQGRPVGLYVMTFRREKRAG